MGDGDRLHVERIGGEREEFDGSAPELAGSLSSWRRAQARARVRVLSVYGGTSRPDPREVDGWAETLDLKLPARGAALSFREAGATIRLEWEGPRREEPSYWIEYRLGAGILSAAGAFAVEDPWIGFGPFPLAFWNDLSSYSPFRFRILDPGGKRRSAWRSFTVEKAPP